MIGTIARDAVALGIREQRGGDFETPAAPAPRTPPCLEIRERNHLRRSNTMEFGENPRTCVTVDIKVSSFLQRLDNTYACLSII